MPDPKARVRLIVHAGFHRAATTTVQRTLRQNAALLRPGIAIAMRPRLLPIVNAARGYSVWRDPLTLMKFGHRVGEYLRAAPLGNRNTLCLSAEELSGHMAGRHAVPDHAHVPDLMAEFAEVAALVHGSALKLTILFSTRDAAAWLHSSWAEHVRSARMRLSAAEYAETYAAAADLGAIVAQVRTAIAPHRVVMARLEDCIDMPLGPAQALFDLLPLTDWQRQRLTPVKPANIGLPPDVVQRFLALNRSNLGSAALEAEKKAILAARNLG